jgi:hypothetical protein
VGNSRTDTLESVEKIPDVINIDNRAFALPYESDVKKRGIFLGVWLIFNFIPLIFEPKIFRCMPHTLGQRFAPSCMVQAVCVISPRQCNLFLKVQDYEYIFSIGHILPYVAT